MIIELYGLPAAGKTTLARAFEQEGAVLIRAPKGLWLMLTGVWYCAAHPVQALGQLWFLMRHARTSTRYMLFVNLFLVHAGKWRRAKACSREGKVAVIDQGHHQNLLSLFSDLPGEEVLRKYCSYLPVPDLLLVVEADGSERAQRLKSRAELNEALKKRREVAEQIFESTIRILEVLRPLVIMRISNEAGLAALMKKHVTYATIARMPTEKAHGISIAHLCTTLAGRGSQVELVVPLRRTPAHASIFEYYGVPKNFKVSTVRAFDFIGNGFTHPLFFFLQRVLFLLELKKRGVLSGALYTREPEIAWAFSSSHYTVFEAHRWPKGIAGFFTALLLRNVSLVVCNSSGTEAAVRKAGINRTLVAPNGFDAEAFSHAESKEASRARLGLSGNAKIAMYVGLLAKGKGVRTFFETARLLAPRVQIVVIGGSEEEVRVLKKDYPDVIFLGYRPYTELPSNLAAADVLVLPNTRADIESMSYTSPIKLFSYMAAGVPIVASRVPAAFEVLGESNGWFVEPDSPEALAQGITECLENGEESLEKAARAQAAAAGYTWENRGTRIHERLGAIV